MMPGSTLRDSNLKVLKYSLGGDSLKAAQVILTWKSQKQKAVKQDAKQCE